MKNVLIVEDEILIAYTIAKYLKQQSYNVVGIAISYNDAVKILSTNEVSIVLIDIKLSGEKTGIDLAHVINEKFHLPFIYLTAQLDQFFIKLAKETNPKGYLAKPIQKESLYTTLEIIQHNSDRNSEYRIIKSGTLFEKIFLDEILYIQAEHIYLNIFLENRTKPLLVRQSISNILITLDSSFIIQTHRAFLVNIKKVDKWNPNTIEIGSHSIPISRTQKKQTLSKITNHYSQLQR